MCLTLGTQLIVVYYDQPVFTVACILTYIVKGRQRQNCRENYNHAAYR